MDKKFIYPNTWDFQNPIPKEKIEKLWDMFVSKYKWHTNNTYHENTELKKYLLSLTTDINLSKVSHDEISYFYKWISTEYSYIRGHTSRSLHYEIWCDWFHDAAKWIFTKIEMLYHQLNNIEDEQTDSFTTDKYLQFDASEDTEFIFYNYVNKGKKIFREDLGCFLFSNNSYSETFYVKSSYIKNGCLMVELSDEDQGLSFNEIRDLLTKDATRLLFYYNDSKNGHRVFVGDYINNTSYEICTYLKEIFN